MREYTTTRIYVSVKEYRRVAHLIEVSDEIFEFKDIKKARAHILSIVGSPDGTRAGFDEDGLKYIEWEYPPGSRGGIIKHRVNIVEKTVTDLLAIHTARWLEKTI